MSDWSTIGTDGPRAPLTRSREAEIAGVARGIGGFIRVNPNIVRVLFCVLALAGGAGFLAYIGLWLLIPGPDPGAGENRAPLGLAAGGALLLLAAIVGLLALGGVGTPFNLIVLTALFAGIAILNRRPRGWAERWPTQSMAGDSTSTFDWPAPSPEPVEQPEPAPQPPQPEPAPIVEQAVEMEAARPDPTVPFQSPVENPVESPVEKGALPTMDQVHRTHWAVPRMADETIDTVAKISAPPGPPLGLIALASLAAVLGVALVLNTLAHIFVGATTVVGSGMAIVGLLMTIGSFKGRILPLVPIAIGLLVLLPASPIIDHAITDGVGSSDVTVASVEDLLPEYQVGVGSLALNLSQLEITEDTVVEAKVGTGSLEVALPQDVAVLARGDTTIGGLWILGEGRGGIGNELRVRPPSSYSEDAPVLILDVETTIGTIDVYRVGERSSRDEAPIAEIAPFDLPEPPPLDELFPSETSEG